MSSPWSELYRRADGQFAILSSLIIEAITWSVNLMELSYEFISSSRAVAETSDVLSGLKYENCSG